MVAERVLRSLSAPIAIEGHQLNLQPSIGVAIAPTDGRDVVGLLKAASAAKRHAKREGGNKIAFYHRDIGEAGEERLRLESDLRRAIESGELSLHYLPQVDTNSGSVVGAEALLRWQHPEQGQIPPGKLIGLAEDVGLIGVLGNWVLQEACRQLRRFTDEGVKLAKMAIKVSAEQFNADFARRVIAVTDEYKIGPGQLELALSEAIMTCKDPESIAALGHLREAGVYLSVDDFGTAYSPLSYLSQYSLDEIKIDRSFLLEADKSEAGANLLAGIIAMANELGLKVLASGVETESQFHFLTSHGTHLIQGYLLSKAVSPEALRPMLVPWHFVDRVQQLAAIAPGAARARAPVA
jgi:EAL domain-containing protein (putative c-di-GMP-specific phosphodiesterase class I)